MRSGRLTFPLVPRRRVIGLSFGTMRSLRRGSGSDVAGSRPYYPGDDMDAIDWAASARLSTARGRDEFVVRERFAEEAPRIVIVCDRRPQMAHFASPLPWLDKPQAMRNTVELILASAGASGGYVGYLDYADGDPHWRQPKGERKLIELKDERLWSSEYGGPQDWLERSIAHLAQHRRAVSPGTFIFVLQDPVWEQSFPDVSGIVVPLRDPETGRVSNVRLKRREIEARREANEQRMLDLIDGFRLLDIDPIVLSSDDKSEILAPFLMWTELRRTRRVIGA